MRNISRSRRKHRNRENRSKIYFTFFLACAKAKLKIMNIEYSSNGNTKTRKKGSLYNWKIITNFIDFSIKKYYRIQLDLNESVWLLDTLERLAEQKLYNEKNSIIKTKPIYQNI